MFKKSFLLIFLWMTSCFAEYKYDLSICTIFRDEAPYLKEWIEFHRMLGVQHFYLCNHNSVDNFREVLAPYIQQGIVELRERLDDDRDRSLAFFNLIQQDQYFTEIVNVARGESKWVAFLDSDEYLFSPQNVSLVEVLKDYEEFGGVAVNWQMFGTSNVAKFNPQMLIIEQLIRCAPVNHEYNYHVKSIVKPDCAAGFPNPHYANYFEGRFQVNTNKEAFGGPFSPSILIDKLRINHYFTRDEDYFHRVKIPRRANFGFSKEWMLNENAESNTCIDLSIQRFVPALRQRMGLN